jgi:YD repeat-containing protein
MGRPIQTTQPDGSTATLVWDSVGRLSSSTSPEGATTTFAYGVNPSTETQTLNNSVTTRTFDGFGRLAMLEAGDTTGVQAVRQFAYGPAANAPMGRLKGTSLICSPSSSPVWVNRTYDDLGRLSSQSSPVGGGATTYSHAGSSVTVTDPAGRVKTLSHLVGGRLKSVTQSVSGGSSVTQYSSNARSEMTAVGMSGPEGQQKRSFGFDVNGRLTTLKEAEAGAKTYSYNPDGTIAGRTDAIGQSVQYMRDSFKRVTAENRYDPAGNPLSAQCVSYFYDSNPFDSSFSANATGRAAAAQWGAGDTLPGLIMEMYSYTPSGNLAGKKLVIQRGLNAASLVLTYSYDNEGRTSSVAYPGGGPSLTWSYDTLGRVSALNSSSGPVVSSVSDAPHGGIAAITQLATSEGDYLGEQRTYDSRNRLTRITATPVDPGTSQWVPSLDLGYSYVTGDGRVASETDYLRSDAVSYSYDNMARLTTAQTSSGIWAWRWALTPLETGPASR